MSIIDRRRRAGAAAGRRLGARARARARPPVEYDAWDLESWTRAPGRAIADADVESTIVDAGPLRRPRRSARDRFGPSSSDGHVRRCAPAARGSTSTSTSTGTTTSSCCRWRSRSTCAPTRRRATSSSAIVRRPTHRVELVGRRQVRGVRAPLRRPRPSPTSVSRCSTTAATGTACSTERVRVSLARAASTPTPPPTTAVHTVDPGDPPARRRA